MSDYTAPKPMHCPYCGYAMSHPVEQCPAVKKIEYYPDGHIKSVEKR